MLYETEAGSNEGNPDDSRKKNDDKMPKIALKIEKIKDFSQNNHLIHTFLYLISSIIRKKYTILCIFC